MLQEGEYYVKSAPRCKPGETDFTPVTLSNFWRNENRISPAAAGL